MVLGSVKVKTIGLGAAGVLFAGILVGQPGKAVDCHTLDFVNEFGLILVVFTIGLQLGPSFFAALQQQGVTLNMLAATIVLQKMNFMDLSELLAGSVTDPPVLDFAANVANSDAPTVANATGYSLTTLLPVLSAQVLAIALFR